ncbi:MAG: hypothetical protein AAF735_04830 [Myxococcota bacterium]
MIRRPRIDIELLAAELEVDWTSTRAALLGLYEELDERLLQRTAGLNLPCHRGCSACCHESVFVTPLEFLLAWESVQQFSDPEFYGIIERGLELYEENRDLIAALDDPARADSHDAIARRLRFTCPMLGVDGACRIYEARELYARLFGCSFNDAGGIYGCALVGAHLAGQTVTLPATRVWASRLAELPLTFKRQVYPYWIAWLYA